MKQNLNTTIAAPLDILKGNGYKYYSDLNYCTDNGVEYFIGWKEDKALIVALIHDENIYLINKSELREMSLTAKTKGVKNITLLTNYGLELHSRLEKAETVGLNKIIKISNLLKTDKMAAFSNENLNNSKCPTCGHVKCLCNVPMAV